MAKNKYNSESAFKSILGLNDEGKTGEQPDQREQQTDAKEKNGTSLNDIISPRNKEKEETRSKRVNLVIKPSVYNLSKEKCRNLNISLNECINQFLEAWSKE